MANPILTVVMPVYNGEKYLKEAIDSVLGQTFEDFELLVINDGSMDQSLPIIASYKDNRIRLLNNEVNRGIPYTRNLGLKEAKGKFLTWMDCDDISLPQRLELQMNFLRERREYGGCGTWLVRFKGDIEHHVYKAQANPDFLKATMLFKTSIPNATVMLRLSEVRRFGLVYNENLPIAEDYEFILNCSRYFKFSNIQKVLYRYRDSETSIMNKYDSNEDGSFEVLKKVYVQSLGMLGISPSEGQLNLHRLIASRQVFGEMEDYVECYKWLLFIKTTNQKKKLYPKKVFNRVLRNQFFFISKKASYFGLRVFAFFLRKSMVNGWDYSPLQIGRLAIRCLLKYDKFEFKLGRK